MIKATVKIVVEIMAEAITNKLTKLAVCKRILIDLNKTFTIQSQIFYSLRICHSQKYLAPGGFGIYVLCTSFTYLSHLLIDLNETFAIQSQTNLP